MANNPNTLAENAGRITAPDANYTYGSAKDDSTGTTGDGTPIKKAYMNDIYGMQQALLKAANIVPSGNADTEVDSQYLEAMKQVLKTGRKNLIINGNFDIWQRGVAFTGIEFTADRWKSLVAVNVDRSTTAPDGSAYSAAIDPLGSLRTHIELPATGDPGAFILGRVFTFSMMVKSASASTMGVSIRFIDGSAGGNPTPTTAILSNEPTTTGWTKVSGSIAIPDAPNASNTCLQVVIDPTVATNIAQVQLEEGTVATDFEYRPIAEELALCQRYYRKSYDEGVAPGAVTNAGAVQYVAASTSAGQPQVPLGRMRTTPSVTTYSPVTGASGQVWHINGAADTPGSVTNLGETGFLNSVGAHVDTNSYRLHYTADAEL
jgi:hypothetical protein